MMPHPFERFLGVDQDADPFTMLGLTPQNATPLAIDDALRRRLGDIFKHPDGRSYEAEMVRSALREAANSIKLQMKMQRQAESMAASDAPAWMQQAVRSKNRPRAAAPTPLNLTAFDKLVLAALVACGGWNARSRAQLVALSQQYGVSVQGLLRVMQGLSEYARSGGPRIGVTDIASRPSSMPLAPIGISAPPPIGVALLDRLADNLGQELKRGGAWPTIKLAIIFGIVTIVVGIISLRAILSRGGEPSPNQQQQAAAQNDAAATRPTTAKATSPSAVLALARFPTTPTFLGNGLPADAVNAVDRLPNLAAQIEELGRKIAVANGEPSDAVYRQWEDDINTIALSWSIGDASTRMGIEKSMFETLRAAGDTPAVSDRLLKTLVPPISVVAPIDLLRGTWMAGMLAKIASSNSVPPVVADRARSLLEISLSQNIRGAIASETAGDLWLAQRLPQLTQMLLLSEAPYDAWELWLSAQRAIGLGERYDAAIAHALRSILETDYDIAVPGAAVNVAARLLTIALQSGSAVSRQRLLDLFNDERIAARDLWVLTSILTTADEAPWFPDRLLTPEDADMAHRYRVRDDLAKAWPAPEPPANADDADDGLPQIDPMEGERWAAAVDAMLARPEGSDQTTLMHHLIDASRMIEAAAALVTEAPDEARQLMKQIEEGWSAAPASPAPSTPSSRPPLSGGGGGGGGGQAPARSGQPIGPDGMWARQYAEAGKAIEARLDSLRSLRSTAGTDLGPIDATLLVKEAYRGSPQEVRSVAQAVIEQQFSIGPNVAMQLLDQLPDAPAIDSISELIGSMTGRMLPDVRSTAWVADARLALVMHALNLKDQSGAPVDGLLEPLIESYAGRLAHARGDMSVLSSASSPQEAATLLLRALTSQAELAAPVEAVPADLPSLQRRHNSRLSLADGPIQSFVAMQLAILDVTAYQLVADRPKVRDRAIEILRDHAQKRMQSTNVLTQAIDVEQAILELWRLRLGFDPQLPEHAGEEEQP